MATKADKKKPKRGLTKAKAKKASSSPAKPQATLPAAEGIAASDSAQQRFVKDLLVRGEAVEPSPEGKVPWSATHAITQRNADGSAEVKRVRVKLV